MLRKKKLRTSVRPPRVLTHSFPLMSAVSTANGSVQLLGFDLFGSLTPAYSLYTISVRQTRVLPPPSFGFHLAMDTLGFGCILPTAGRIRDFHPLERALAGRTMKRPAQPHCCTGLSVIERCFSVLPHKNAMHHRRIHGGSDYLYTIDF